MGGCLQCIDWKDPSTGFIDCKDCCRTGSPAVFAVLKNVAEFKAGFNCLNTQNGQWYHNIYDASFAAEPGFHKSTRRFEVWNTMKLVHGKTPAPGNCHSEFHGEEERFYPVETSYNSSRILSRCKGKGLFTLHSGKLWFPSARTHAFSVRPRHFGAFSHTSMLERARIVKNRSPFHIVMHQTSKFLNTLHDYI